MDAKGQLYALNSAITYEGLEHMQIFISVGCPRTNLHIYWGTGYLSFRSEWLYSDFQLQRMVSLILTSFKDQLCIYKKMIHSWTRLTQSFIVRCCYRIIEKDFSKKWINVKMTWEYYSCFRVPLYLTVTSDIKLIIFCHMLPFPFEK